MRVGLGNWIVVCRVGDTKAHERAHEIGKGVASDRLNNAAQRPVFELFAGHAARPQGSMLSSMSICSSDRLAIISCRQPVLRKMWIAKGREGWREPDVISLAYEREIPAFKASSE